MSIGKALMGIGDNLMQMSQQQIRDKQSAEAAAEQAAAREAKEARLANMRQEFALERDRVRFLMQTEEEERKARLPENQEKLRREKESHEALMEWRAQQTATSKARADKLSQPPAGKKEKDPFANMSPQVRGIGETLGWIPRK